VSPWVPVCADVLPVDADAAAADRGDGPGHCRGRALQVDLGPTAPCSVPERRKNGHANVGRTFPPTSFEPATTALKGRSAALPLELT
jgi:hypothetical protein